MVWFDVLSKFLRNFEPSPEVIEEVYGTFKAYFPISLPRASQSGITPEELKQALRSCFTSNYQLAPHTFPFLVGKLDQGDGVTVNVKVDILRTIQACVEEYQNPEQSVAPYFEQVWASLKYEVRNGEIEDTIWATLEVLKAFARRLQGDKLRDYALSVTRDCVHDLSNAMYTAAAGRLLVSVLSASPAAFVLMASPAITHIKENLRHPKSPSHTQDLLKLLHVLLETRLLLVDAEMTAQERSDFTAIDVGFTSLYGDVYEKPVGLGLAAGAGQDDLKTASQAVQGVGALVCQRSAAAAVGDGTSTQLLLPESKCLEICEVLFSLVIRWTTGDDATRNEASDELVNETIKALQRTVTSIPNAFAPLVKKALGLIQPAWKEQGAASVPVIQAYGPILAYIGCSELPRSSPGFGLKNLLILTSTLSRELLAAIESGADVQVWSALVAGLQSSARHFNDACRTTESETETAWSDNSLADIVQKYPSLDSSKPVEDIASHVSASQAPSSAPAIRVDFLLSSLAIARQLYLNATKPGESSTGKTINLSDRLSGSDISSENQYLHLVATLTGFILHEMSETQQTQLAAQNYALHLFRSDYIQVQATASAEDSATRLDAIGQAGQSSWDWLAFDRVNILSRGILEALRPSAVAKLVSEPHGSGRNSFQRRFLGC
jgi:DNA repair/transcription protein MET18/MMS19